MEEPPDITVCLDKIDCECTMSVITDTGGGIIDSATIDHCSDCVGNIGSGSNAYTALE